MDLQLKLNWDNISTKPSRSYKCGFCGSPLASTLGYNASCSAPKPAYIYICHFCSRPTYFDPNGDQIPGVTFGNDVSDIDDESVRDLYAEARRATSANCNTSVVLCCRKLLMHISVSKGAKEGESFVSYVNFLSENNYIPPGAKIWVDHIREIGNEANHEINISSKEDAQELLSFCEMLLKIIFEFPAKVKKRYPEKTS